MCQRTTPPALTPQRRSGESGIRNATVGQRGAYCRENENQEWYPSWASGLPTIRASASRHVRCRPSSTRAEATPDLRVADVDVSSTDHLSHVARIKPLQAGQSGFAAGELTTSRLASDRAPAARFEVSGRECAPIFGSIAVVKCNKVDPGVDAHMPGSSVHVYQTPCGSTRKSMCGSSDGKSHHIDYQCYMNRSHSISVVQNAHVDQNTICAVLRLSVAFFNCLFPLPTFSVVSCESATSWSMCSAWILRFAARVVCSSEISSSDFSAVLVLLVCGRKRHVRTYRTWSRVSS